MSSETENYMAETSIGVDPRQSFDGSSRTLGSSRYSPRRSESSFEENYIRVTEFEENSPHDSTPVRPMIRIAPLSETDSCHDWDDVDEKSNGNFDESCKVVRCIGSEELIPKVYVESYGSSPDTKIRVPSAAVFHDDHRESPLEYTSPESKEMNEHNKVVQEPLKEDREMETPLKEDETGKLPLKEQLEPKDSTEDDYVLTSPQNFKLPKSRSCNEGIHATWLDKLEQNTPPNGDESYYTGRPPVLPIKSCTFNYGVDIEKGTVDQNSNEPEKKMLIEEEDTSITNSLTSTTKAPTEGQDDKQVDDTHVSLFMFNTN